jgi:hypothetical protein
MRTLPVFLLTAALAAAQGLNPVDILKPLANDWPTYSGDYSGQRYSRLTQINQANVKNLTLAWTARVSNGPGAAGGGGFRFGPAGPPLITGGEGTGEFTGGFGGGTNIRASILAVDGKLYFPPPITPGPSTHATAASSGTTTGKPKAAPTSATAASVCGVSGSTWKPRTTT